ncbi:hypothetical protein C0J52_05696 [Blattella germanica]|nr:hypothetical protein C0J52_05696 [Blattella germanica]
MHPRAEVWEHFDSRQVQGKREAKCKYCGTVYKNTLASRLREHINKLNAVHNLSNAWVQRRHKDLPRRGAQHL